MEWLKRLLGIKPPCAHEFEPCSRVAMFILIQQKHMNLGDTAQECVHCGLIEIERQTPETNEKPLV